MAGIPDPDPAVQIINTQTMQCMKCQRGLQTSQVAMFIRAEPGAAFWPWCPRCTYEVVAAALLCQFPGGLIVSL